MAQGWLLILYFALTLLAAAGVGAGWIALMAWRHRDRSGILSCTQCGYNLEGNTSGACSECGHPIDRCAPDPGVPLGALRDIAGVLLIVAPYLAVVSWMWRNGDRDLLSDVLWEPWAHAPSGVGLFGLAVCVAVQFVVIERLVNVGRLHYSIGRAAAWLTAAVLTPLALVALPLPAIWVLSIVFRLFEVWQ